MSRTCSVCKKEKDDSFFYRVKEKICKKCTESRRRKKAHNDVEELAFQKFGDSCWRLP